MTLESSRNLGGVGAILLLAAAVGFFVQPLLLVLGFVGAVLVLVALHGLASVYREQAIFNHALFSFVFLIVGAIATFAAFVYLFFLTPFGNAS